MKIRLSAHVLGSATKYIIIKDKAKEFRSYDPDHAYGRWEGERIHSLMTRFEEILSHYYDSTEVSRILAVTLEQLADQLEKELYNIEIEVE